MAKTASTIAQLDGTFHLKIDKVVESNQLLVTLSRNGKEWLSPVGWVKQEKGTLLDCQSRKDHTIVEIPAEFAKKIKTGDQIELKSREIDFSAALTWGKLNGSKTDTAKKANGAAPLEAMSLEESEKRAKDAEKTAAQYRAQMEEASKAREAAQAAALEAARKADEALKAEADRIAEMERAAKAFEDAERKRMEEQRRLDRERRLEEERKAEEARIAEEARLAAEAERLKKERTEARKFFKGQISETKSEKSRLQEVLDGFKSKAESAEAEIADSDKRLSRLEKSLAAAQKEEADNKAALSREENRIGELKSTHNKIQASISDIEKGNEKLFKSLERAESVHEKALKEVEAAKIRAAEALKALSTIKVQTDKVKSQRDGLKLEQKDAQSKLSAHEKHLSELRLSYDASRQNAEKEKTGLSSIKKTKDDLAAKLNSAKTDIARTLQDIKAKDETLKRQQASLKQIEDIENADDIRRITGLTTSAEPRKTNSGKTSVSGPVAKAATAKTSKTADSSGKGGFLSRFFSRSGQDTVPTGTTKTTVAKSTPPAKPEVKASLPLASIPAAKKVETPLSIKAPVQPNGRGDSGVRLNSWLLMGIAVAGIATIGTAVAINSNDGQKIADKSQNNKTVKTEAPIETAKLIASAETISAEKIDAAQSSGMIPDMTPVEDIATQSLASAALTEITPEKEAVKVESPVKKPVTPKTAKTEPVQKPASKPRPRARAASTTNYEAVTRQVQEQLSFLGFYNGPLDGQQTRQTQQSMAEFKALYDLPANNNLTGSFLNTLKRAYEEQVELREANTFIVRPVEPVVQVVDNTISLPALDTPAINTSTSVDYTNSNSAEQQIFDSVAREAAIIQPVNTAVIPETVSESLTAAPVTDEPALQQVAEISLPAAEISAPVEDTIVPARVIRKARAEYPLRLLRQNKTFDAKVFVIYDVDETGKVINPIVKSVDFEGSSGNRKLFEKAAINAVKRQKFEPRLVNGEATTEKDRTTRISFNVEE